MAKAKAKKQDDQATIAYHALTRAADRIKAEREVGELEPGSYPFDLAVNAKGELIVEQGTPAGEPETVADIKAADIVAGLIASVPAEERETVLSNAIGAFKAAGDEDRKAHTAEADRLIFKIAKRRKLTKEQAKPGRRGAVKAKPSVAIRGSAGASTVSVEVDAA